MRNLLAAGWLIIALVAFWLAYWVDEGAVAAARFGMALYALLLILTLVVFVREWLNAPRQGGGEGG